MRSRSSKGCMKVQPYLAAYYWACGRLQQKFNPICLIVTYFIPFLFIYASLNTWHTVGTKIVSLNLRMPASQARTQAKLPSLAVTNPFALYSSENLVILQSAPLILNSLVFWRSQRLRQTLQPNLSERRVEYSRSVFSTRLGYSSRVIVANLTSLRVNFIYYLAALSAEIFFTPLISNLKYLIMDGKEQIKASLALMRRLPPSQLKKSMAGLQLLVDQATSDIIAEKVCCPLTVLTDSSGKQFIGTEFNRQADSFRSPFTNQYVPPLEDGFRPSQALRQLQQKGNRLFTQYTKLYYDSAGVGSFFVSDQEYGFDCAFFAHKEVEADQEEGLGGSTWDSFNIMEVHLNVDDVSYKLKSTVLVEIKLAAKELGSLSICGFLEHALEKSFYFAKEKDLEQLHLQKIGSMVEECENILRKQLEAVEAEKTKQVLCSTRFKNTRVEEEGRQKLAQNIKMLILPKPGSK